MNSIFPVDEEQRFLIKTITHDVIEQLEPEILPIAQVLFDPLIAAVAAGETIVIQPASDELGGMGAEEILTTIVVPIVVGVVSHLLVKTIDQVSDRTKRNAEIERIVSEETKRVLAAQPKSLTLHRKAALISRTISDAVAKRLQ